MSQPLELTVMMYHYVRDRGDQAEAGSGIPGMSVKTFEAQLDDLSKKHTFVSWPEVCGALTEGKSLPRSACLLTFDDGVRDHYLNVFRILKGRNISGLFFILARHEADGLVLGHKIHFLLARQGPDELRAAVLDKLDLSQREHFIRAEQHYRSKYPTITLDDRINLLKTVLQRNLSTDANPILGELFELHIGSENEIALNYYLNSNQIREMTASGMHFGGHSHSHPWFDWIDAEARVAEIKASADWIQQFEPGPWAFAYPYGGLSEDSPDLLKKHGFAAAFTTRAHIRHSDAYFIGRLDGEGIAQDGQGYV